MTERDERLLEFATERQAEVLRAWWENGTIDAAAAALGVHRSTFGKTLKAVQAKAARAGYAPGTDNMKNPIPEGYFVKRRSARFDKEGKPAGGWVISEPDADAREAALAAMIEALKEELPRVAPVPAPAHTDSKLCNVFTLTDAHIGALAWHRLRGGIDGVVRVTVTDPDDPVTEWVFSSRTPDRVVAMIVAVLAGIL